MSDDYDFDDAFDDSFLREVDSIAASATSTAKSSLPKPPARTGSLPITSFNKGWTGPQRSISSSSARPPPPAPPALALRKQPSSDDVSLSPRDKGAQARRLALMALSANTTSSTFTTKITAPAKAHGTNLGIPSSKLARTSSGSTNFQTHLNFRKENQTTKGKRWDRTAFAASGRRMGGKNEGAVKARQKKKGWEPDEDEEEEMDDDDDDDLGGPLAPAPKPRVDVSRGYDPPKHLPDMATVNAYVYPTNRPKRDYQYDIVRACFADNCLVALPTGLGKTFVAGVVMLNFYRWFPTGKIVFLAPTKPLVNQQIEACQMTCGIPSKDAAVMTGSSVSAKERAKLWQERRVFYCTPQTMYNDLEKGRLDPRDIVLAVFDEAHKASGSYAYTLILAFLTAHQPFFRVLALTATPGADVPKVQGVVDALHISRIEIREAEDPAISKYMNEKRTERHVVPMTEVIEGFRDRWAALMRPLVQKLVDKNVLTDRDLDTKRLKPFRLTSRRMEINRDRTSGLRWALGTLQSLERMARAMTHLLEFSLGMFRTTLLEIAGNTSSDTGKKSGSKGNSNSMRNNFEFQKLLRDVEAEMNLMRMKVGGRGRSDAHPKMAKTMELLLAHFTQAADDERDHGIKNDTRAMVFCSFRDCVLEVVDMLNDHPDLLKATKFVGQSQGKQEKDKGFNQKEQKKTINDFKQGIHNILVSTSIGEEGLDIGEVDFVVIYDMPKQSIKLLQRIGRTGRKRSGQVHVLMSENREDLNWDSAQQTHREIQEEILHSRNLELFEDVERLLPPGPFPICEEKEMPVDPWDPEDQKRKIAASPKSKAKDKEKDREPIIRGDPVPDGASSGFRSVADLLREQGKMAPKEKSAAGGRGKGKEKAVPAEKKGRKRKVASPVRSESEGEVVEDEELLYGPIKTMAGRPLKKAKKATGGAKAKRGKGKKGMAQEEEEEEEEADDPKIIKRKAEEIRKKREESTEKMGLDFFNTLGPVRHRPPTPDDTPPSSPSSPLARRTGDVRATHPPLSPNTDESDPITRKAPVQGDGRLSPTTAKLAGFSQVPPIDFSWDDSDEDMDVNLSKVKTQEARVEEEEGEEEDTLIPSAPTRRIGLTKPRTSTPAALGPSKSTLAMPPPPVPHHRTSSPARPPGQTTPTFDATQFPVRRPGARRARVILSSSERENGVGMNSGEASSPLVPVGPGATVRIQQVLQDGSSPIVARRVRRIGRGKVPKANVQEYLDVDVEVSGSDSGDESPEEEENESDRVFAGSEFAPTQAPRGYNQRAMYMAGLSTQAGKHAGLGFQQRGDKEGFLAKARKPVLVTDSEGSEGEESENEYQLGSFVVQDDEDLGFEASEGDSLSYA